MKRFVHCGVWLRDIEVHENKLHKFARLRPEHLAAIERLVERSRHGVGWTEIRKSYYDPAKEIPKEKLNKFRSFMKNFVNVQDVTDSQLFSEYRRLSPRDKTTQMTRFVAQVTKFEKKSSRFKDTRKNRVLQRKRLRQEKNKLMHSGNGNIDAETSVGSSQENVSSSEAESGIFDVEEKEWRSTRQECTEQGNKKVPGIGRRTKSGKWYAVCADCGAPLSKYKLINAEKRTYKGTHPVHQTYKKKNQEKPPGDDEIVTIMPVVPEEKIEVPKPRAKLDGYHLTSDELEDMYDVFQCKTPIETWITWPILTLVSIVLWGLRIIRATTMNMYYITNRESLLTYTGEKRLAGNRNVKEIEEDLVVMRTNKKTLVCSHHRKIDKALLIDLAIGPAYMIMWGIWLVVDAMYDTRITNVVLKPAEMYYETIILFVFGVLTRMITGLRYKKIQIDYVPHILSSVLLEYGPLSTEADLDLTVHQKMNRLACLPLPDVEVLQISKGTIVACETIISREHLLFVM